jgi:predicted small lipoprotein YifL
MQRKNLVSKFFIFTMSIMLFSCGQTGELYLPDEKENLDNDLKKISLSSDE